MNGKKSWTSLLIGACIVGLWGCATVDVNANLAKHREDGSRREFDLPLDRLKDVLAAMPWSEVKFVGGTTPSAMDGYVVSPRQEPNSFDFIFGPSPCIIDLSPSRAGGAGRTGVKVVCLRGGETRWAALEGYILNGIAGAVAKERSDRPVAAPGIIAKEELATAVQAAVSDVDQPGYRRAENADLFAVVIGVEQYRDLPKAKFADHDASAVRAHLLALGVPSRNIFYATDQEATRASFVKAVHTWLPNRLTPASTVFFYYSGHGAPDPQSQEAYLVPIDGDPEALADTAYSLKTLYRNLGQLKAKRVIVALDSCFSGAGGRSVLAGGARPLVTTIDRPESSGNMIVFSASSGGQISGTLDEQAHGAFTYYLLKGLNGGAADAGGSVSVRALYDYLRPKVADAARLHNRDQTPELSIGSDAGADLTLR
jgi:hypothetical protein